MKKAIIFLFALLVHLTAQAELRSGHFFKSLKNENLTEQKAVECFNQWFTLPQETEWRKVSERTNRLGMTRVEYRQYVDGVEVEHSQVLLHVKNGLVKTANGTVMEARQMPAKVRSYSIIYQDGTPTDLLGNRIFLVSTKDGYRYATKVLSADSKYWIYTDVETHQVLKRIPTRHNLTAQTAKVTGKSVYSGDVEMDASLGTETGTYFLWDQERNIHTMFGATLPTFETMMKAYQFSANFPEIELPAPEEQMTEAMWEEWFKDGGLDIVRKTPLDAYLLNNATYASSSTNMFDSYHLKKLTIDKLLLPDPETGELQEVVPSMENPVMISVEVCYTGTEGYIDGSDFMLINPTYKIELNLEELLDELPETGADIRVYYYVPRDTNNEENPGDEESGQDDETGEGDEPNMGDEPSEGDEPGQGDGNEEEGPKKELMALFTVIPDGSGVMALDAPNVKGTVTYDTEKSSWMATDIHWGMAHTYDFYKNVMGRASFDDKGSPIYNLFCIPTKHSQGDYMVVYDANNAGALTLGTSMMMYGMGSHTGGQDAMKPVVELTVMAHEYTHLVTDHTANLVYQGESGALNESFSDLMGISVKKYVQGDEATWNIGEGVYLNYSSLRSMSDPKSSKDGTNPSPDTYQGEYWASTEGDTEETDFGGVHANSGVQNKWFHLLTDGGEGTNDNNYSYQVKGIGIEKSQQIAYHTLTEYATNESQYADIRLASLQAAKDLYGDNSAEAKAVDAAWLAVGVGDDDPATAIQTIASPSESNQTIYDLQGRQVNSLRKGLYIQNGRKFVVK